MARRDQRATLAQIRKVQQVQRARAEAAVTRAAGEKRRLQAEHSALSEAMQRDTGHWADAFGDGALNLDRVRLLYAAVAQGQADIQGVSDRQRLADAELADRRVIWRQACGLADEIDDRMRRAKAEDRSRRDEARLTAFGEYGSSLRAPS